MVSKSLADEALLLYAETLKLERPAQRTLVGVENWYNGDEPDENYPIDRSRHLAQFGGAMSGIFKERKHELVSLYKPAENDRVANFLAKIPWLFQVFARAYLAPSFTEPDTAPRKRRSNRKTRQDKRRD